MSDIIEKFKQQDQAARIACQYQYNSVSDSVPRVALCLKAMRKDAVTVDLKKNSGSIKAHYSNLQTCGSVWACPVCASKISEVRKNEVDELLKKTENKHHVFMTYTVPHYSHQSCKVVKDLFMSSRRKMKAQKKLKSQPDFIPYSQLMKHYKYDGSVTTVEVTYGVNGWHVHAHELLIFDDEIPESEQQKFHTIIRTNWERALRRNKVEIHNYQAFKKRAVITEFLTETGKNRYSDYLVKIEKAHDTENAWGIACELSKSHLKKSDHTEKEARNITPFGMLAAMAQDHSLYEEWSYIFAEYMQTFKGARFLFFSKGLKKKYGISEISDQEIMQESDILASLYGFFEKSEWEKIKAKKLRAWVLDNSDLEFSELLNRLRPQIYDKR